MAPASCARFLNHSSNWALSTIPTKPFSIGISTVLPTGETIRADLALATSKLSGILKSLISLGGIAPPQGLILPRLSMRSTCLPLSASVWAAVEPAGPPPTTTAS